MTPFIMSGDSEEEACEVWLRRSTTECIVSSSAAPKMLPSPSLNLKWLVRKTALRSLARLNLSSQGTLPHSLFFPRRYLGRRR